MKDNEFDTDSTPDEEDDKIKPKRSEKPAQPNNKSQTRMEIYDWLQSVVSAILCGILIFVFIGRIMGVDGSSMLNTLRDKDMMIISNLLYTPKQGDIVVFKTDAYTKPLVKRVIATEGQTIDINFNSGEVLIDGRVIEEDYIREPTMTPEGFIGPKTVPEGFIFVMGDNRNASEDSRSSLVDMVDIRKILGKVLFVVIPGPGADKKRDWSRIGSVYR